MIRGSNYVIVTFASDPIPLFPTSITSFNLNYYVVVSTYSVHIVVVTHESSLKPSCAGINQAIVKVKVALES